MAYRDFKNVSRRKTFDKLLCDKAFETANTSRHDGYKHGLAVLFHECFDKKAGDTSTYIGTKIISDGQTLVNE